MTPSTIVLLIITLASGHDIAEVATLSDCEAAVSIFADLELNDSELRYSGEIVEALQCTVGDIE